MERRRLKSTQWIAASLVFCGLVTCGSCERPIAAPQPAAVRVQKLASETVQTATRFSATVTPKQRVELSFKVPGRVAELLQVRPPQGKTRDVQEGDAVASASKQPIASLEKTDYQLDFESAQARVKAAQAAFDTANRELIRVNPLYEQKVATQKEFDDAVSRQQQASAELDAARVAEQQARDRLDNTDLFAPFDNATVVEKRVERGERIQGGAVAFTIMDLSEVKVAFGVPDTLLAELQQKMDNGSPLEVLSEAFRGQTFQGRVTKIAPVADAKTRTFPVEVTIANPAGLRPDMIVTIKVGNERSAVLVEMTAIQRGKSPDDFCVFKVVETAGKATAIRQKIDIGGIYDNRVQIQTASSDVKEGDAIVVSGASLLHDGQAVRVLPTEPDERKL